MASSGLRALATPLLSLISPNRVPQQEKKKSASLPTFRFPAQVSMPKNGTLVTFGGAEVLKDQAQHLARSREHVTEYTAPNKVHAWTMQLFYLGRDRQERMSGIQK